MRKSVLLSLAALLMLSSCNSTSLYYWGSKNSMSSDDGSSPSLYEELTYLQIDKQDIKSVCRLVAVYEDMVNHPGGIRNVPPPGICAEYAYLLLKPETQMIFDENATDRQKKAFVNSQYGSDYQQKAMKLLEAEMMFYPESVIFIKPLYEKLNK